MRTYTAPAAVVVALGTVHFTWAFLVSIPNRVTLSAVSFNSGRQVGQHISSHTTSPARQTKLLRREMGLSMVSAAFGEKIDTDKVVMDKTASEVLGEVYSEAFKKDPRFLEEIGHGDTRAYTKEELRRKLELAHIFMNLANLVILSRGKDILAPDFKFYSPAMGSLDRDAFLRMTKTVDVAFSAFNNYPADFTVYKDGVVSYKLSIRTIHDGYLVVGDKTYPPTKMKVISDVDLCTVSFSPDGLVRSYSQGLKVEDIPVIVDPEAVAEIADIEKRIENQIAKMQSLEGQESSIAYSKCQSDIDSMLLDKEALEEKVNASPNTQGFGGVRGLFAAIGAEFPTELRDLEGADAYGEIEGQRSAVFSFPSEVRAYGEFDEDSFNEL